jgi:hypothetical protein
MCFPIDNLLMLPFDAEHSEHECLNHKYKMYFQSKMLNSLAERLQMPSVYLWTITLTNSMVLTSAEEATIRSAT